MTKIKFFLEKNGDKKVYLSFVPLFALNLIIRCSEVKAEKLIFSFVLIVRTCSRRCCFVVNTFYLRFCLISLFILKTANNNTF